MKWGLVIAGLFGATAMAAAQDASHPAKSAHGAAHAARPLAVVIPQQFAPAQEVYASMPESADAAAEMAPSPCQLRLGKVAGFQPLPPLVGAGECGATDVVLMETVLLPDQTKVAVTPPATLRCPMAEQVAQWVRADVVPSLKDFPPLLGLDNFASYDCRGRNNIRAAQMSEHGLADALDVGGFKVADGRTLALTDVHVAKTWRDTMRASACARFSTVLGPGSDGFHEEHIHLDLAERRNGYKVCQWEVREPPPPPELQAKAATPPADDTATSVADAATADDQAAPIPLDEVPLPRPRPRTANAAEDGSTSLKKLRSN